MNHELSKLDKYQEQYEHEISGMVSEGIDFPTFEEWLAERITFLENENKRGLLAIMEQVL